MAEKHEEHGMLARGLAEFPIEICEKALAIIKTDQLYRSEKVEGVAEWLVSIQGKRMAEKNSRLKENMLWLAVDKAPPGWCHVRTTMIGTLLEDLASGVDSPTTMRKFAEKMHPLQYQRPTTPPSDENIKQAEEIIAKLQTAGALARRFAKIEDLVTLWKPREITSPPVPPAGVFSHLRQGVKTEGVDLSDIRAQPMTWEKFAKTILPGADSIEYMVLGHCSAAYTAYVTAVNPEAPPILQWDREEKRNPVSWYLYVNGSRPETWGLTTGWTKVTAVSLAPFMWDVEYPMPHHGSSVLFALLGAKDINHKRGGGFFVENLKSDYHQIRRTLEAYVQGATIEGKDEATACGLLLQKHPQPWGTHTFRVTSKGVKTTYLLDRWD